MKKPTPFGKYFLLERINVGGMAEVFRAKAFGVEGFERLVAVKRILPSIAEDQEFIRMFIEEAKLAVQLTHANIAQIFDLGVVDGAYYIALEHVHGRDLRGIFDRCRQLAETMPVAQACFVAMKVCEGLDYAHNKRDQGGRELALVHRDVSPQNILVSFEGEVKLIDFGIAKAADAGALTQSGILKGKFGYMSPEQVRGEPVDRRSDVFSCGIVLYELLTGERLFVGESDYSTLEKVRNVELLPPSTYNRKIPDELERIVLKALAKEPRDRYQNAIDLHDELQAFVYTAGEFYSRKDLAAWMKKTFAREIEDETAKLESYRQLQPPPAMTAASTASTAGPSEPLAAVPRVIPPTKSSPVARSGPLSVVKPPPPPQPVARSGPMPVVVVPPVSAPSAPIAIPAPAPVAASISASAPVVSAPAAAYPAGAALSGAAAFAPAPLAPGRAAKPVELAWDDDEVETRIYDDGEGPSDGEEDGAHAAPAGDAGRGGSQATHRPNLPLQAPVSSSPAIELDGADPLDLPPLPRDGWRAERGEPGPAEGEARGARGPSLGDNGGVAEPAAIASSGRARAALAQGSSDASAPHRSARPRGDSAAAPVGRELSAPSRLVASDGGGAVPRAMDPMATFGARITGGRRPGERRGVPPVVLAGVAIAAVSIAAAIALSGSRGGKPAAPAAPTRPAVVAGDPSTGFDLYVTPAGITQWKLDGESRTDRLPSRIRGIAPGPHTVQIEPPPGFLSQLQKVSVEAGKAPKVEITLQPIPGITGVFDSVPPGALVSLIVDGKRQAIGPSPAKAPLDPRSSYQVLFELSGYVSVNRPIAFSGGLEERVVVNLERAGGERSAPPSTARPASGAPSEPRRAPADSAGDVRRPDSPAAPRPAAPTSDRPAAEPAASKADGAQGVLVLGSKPPCEIAIDGAATGLSTPQKGMTLAVGRHRVTLSNAEFGIKETFTVDIKADSPEKVIKDFSDKLPAGN